MVLATVDDQGNTAPCVEKLCKEQVETDFGSEKKRKPQQDKAAKARNVAKETDETEEAEGPKKENNYSKKHKSASGLHKDEDDSA
ncbi:hypothetical protein VMCG_05604 [Cytospora schulzeri]|uniref:Uncharacterized protein n=1 Tax=Cytospora schulzeri TaxID=448051 RepID=A0A423WF09_9PEZI|nr:hypothetical protein VMCG_05604 [Valsa malicola]